MSEVGCFRLIIMSDIPHISIDIISRITNWSIYLLFDSSLGQRTTNGFGRSILFTTEIVWYNLGVSQFYPAPLSEITSKYGDSLQFL